MAILDILKKKKTKNSSSSKEKERGVEASSAPSARNKKQKTVATQKPPVKEGLKDGLERLSHIIMRPRITEKASTQSGGNSYTFEVARHANKIQIKQAIKEVYNVEPVKVNVISMKPKQKIVRNTLGKTSSYKKAVVFLKDGDTIEFI